MLGQIIQEEVK